MQRLSFERMSWKNISVTILIAWLFCNLSSCALRSVYIPISQNVPLFDSSREVVCGNLYPSANYMDFQTALHPARHLPLATNGNFGSGITVYGAALGTLSRLRASTTICLRLFRCLRILLPTRNCSSEIVFKPRWPFYLADCKTYGVSVTAKVRSSIVSVVNEVIFCL